MHVRTLDRPAGRAMARPAAAATELDDTLFLAAGLSWAACAIHVQAAWTHAAEAASHAIFFVVLAAAQLAWGVAIYRRADRGLLAAGALMSIGVVAIWIASRTSGLPVGPEPWSPEPVGTLDLLATADEVALALLIALRAGTDAGVAWVRGGGRIVFAAGIFIVLLSSVALTLGGGHSH